MTKYLYKLKIQFENSKFARHGKVIKILLLYCFVVKSSLYDHLYLYIYLLNKHFLYL